LLKNSTVRFDDGDTEIITTGNYDFETGPFFEVRNSTGSGLIGGASLQGVQDRG